ncbi:MAG: prenyltransferase/squalene oxidase repeat-containing protein [Thermoguttaceae bacterium]
MANEALPKGNESPTSATATTTAAAVSQAAKSGNPTKPDKPSGAGGATAEQAEVGSSGSWMGGALWQAPSWLVSLVFHMIILLGLALWYVPEGFTDDLRQLIIAPGEEEEFEDLEEFDEPLVDLDVSIEIVTDVTEVVQEQVDISPAEEMEAAAIQVELSEFGLEHAPRNDLLATVGAFSGTGVDGRGSGKAGLVKSGGGSAGSEKAVAAALQWFANHQLPDGGWSFNHTLAPSCRGACRDKGSLAEARNGATAMALLPFLGAGQTHRDGKYKNVVQGGLYFLASRMKLSPNGGALNEGGGSMYSHGLASIALCEAYAMTHDKSLHDPAQASINFICYAQDPVGGGWRYQPRSPGDTSVVGWQIMALKSAHMAYLHVPPSVVKKSITYLDTVQAESGAHYGYTSPGKGQATTAIGLLCRMYLGWKKDHGALQRGAEFISKTGPSKSNMYYNYYATQVMRHMEGDMWKKWNGVMRDQLVNSQSQTGHEKGSWTMGSGHGKKGGRLYCTSMATMILEVYYRHLPIYRKQSTEEDFPE